MDHGLKCRYQLWVGRDVQVHVPGVTGFKGWSSRGSLRAKRYLRSKVQDSLRVQG